MKVKVDVLDAKVFNPVPSMCSEKDNCLGVVEWNNSLYCRGCGVVSWMDNSVEKEVIK